MSRAEFVQSVLFVTYSSACPPLISLGKGFDNNNDPENPAPDLLVVRVASTAPGVLGHPEWETNWGGTKKKKKCRLRACLVVPPPGVPSCAAYGRA